MPPWNQRVGSEIASQQPSTRYEADDKWPCVAPLRLPVLPCSMEDHRAFCQDVCPAMVECCYVDMQGEQGHKGPVLTASPYSLWAEDMKMFFQRQHTDGQWAREKMLNITNH